MWGKNCKMNHRYLFYVAPKESLDSILKTGILPPLDVHKLIAKNKLSREVLGVSYGLDSSNFQDYVSLLQTKQSMQIVAEAICHSRTGRYNDPNFEAVAYVIDGNISKDNKFVSFEKVKEMHTDPYPGEVLYKGPISIKKILYHHAIGTWNF